MSLTKFTGNTNVISQLADVPVQTGDDLKAKFDEAETAIKNYLNNTLTTEVDQLVATEKASLQNLISSLSTSITNSINELNTNKNTMISDGYSNTKVYKIGDLCIYNDTLYRCITAIDEGEAWNSSHWEQTNLGDEVRKEVYSTEEKVVGAWIDGKPIYRKVINTTTGSESRSWKALTNGLNANEMIKYYGYMQYNETENKLLPYAATLADDDPTATIWFQIKGNELQEAHNDTRNNTLSNKPIVLIIEYTKTTD